MSFNINCGTTADSTPYEFIPPNGNQVVGFQTLSTPTGDGFQGQDMGLNVYYGPAPDTCDLSSVNGQSMTIAIDATKIILFSINCATCTGLAIKFKMSVSPWTDLITLPSDTDPTLSFEATTDLT